MPRKRNEQKEQNENYNKAFPTVMRHLMQTTTQAELAGYLSKTRQSITYYCDGSSSPDWETLVKIADFFDVSTDYLLGLTKTKSRDIHIRDIVEITGLNERSVEHLAKNKRIRQQEESTPFIEEAVSHDLDLEKKHLDFLLNETATDPATDEVPEEIKDIMASANISDLQNNADLVIQAALQNRRKVSLENNSHYETLMIEAINHLIENEDKLHILHKIALYLYSSPHLSTTHFRICEAGLSHQFFPLGVDIVSTSFLSEIDDSLKKLREQTEKKYDITTF